MNTQNFNQTGGFPLETDTLQQIQEAYSIFNALGTSVGDSTIITGCEVSGSVVSDGVIYVNSELVTFKGGTLGSTIIRKQDVVRKLFEDGSEPEVVFKPYYTFGMGPGALDWSEFTRPRSNKELSIEQDKKALAKDLTAQEQKLLLLEEAIANFEIPTNTGSIGGVDLDSSTNATLSVFGDVLSVVIEGSDSGTRMIVNVKNNMTDNYRVQIQVESHGNLFGDNNMLSPVFKKISPTQFELGAEESVDGIQNLRFHIQTYTI